MHVTLHLPWSLCPSRTQLSLVFSVHSLWNLVAREFPPYRKGIHCPFLSVLHDNLCHLGARASRPLFLLPPRTSLPPLFLLPSSARPVLDDGKTKSGRDARAPTLAFLHC